MVFGLHKMSDVRGSDFRGSTVCEFTHYAFLNFDNRNNLINYDSYVK